LIDCFCLLISRCRRFWRSYASSSSPALAGLDETLVNSPPSDDRMKRRRMNREPMRLRRLVVQPR